jgi:hypothetical protein
VPGAIFAAKLEKAMAHVAVAAGVGWLRVHDKMFYAECQSFQRSKSGKYEAASGCHDDAVMTLAMVVQVRKRWVRPGVVKLR